MMLTIGQLAAHTGVTVRAVRHYHQIGLLPEPERDASGYRRYGATAVVALIKIRTLADAGVPLARIGRMLEAGPPAFTTIAGQIDAQLSAEIDRLQTSRRHIARLAAGDSLALPPEVVAYLDRLREIGASERMLAAERDGWILMAARWPDQIQDWIPDKFAQLEDARVVRLYRLLSQLMEGGDTDDAALREAVDIMVELAEYAEAAGEVYPDAAGDEMFYTLLDDLADALGERAERMRELLRRRGWDGWSRMQRVPPPPR